MIIPPTAHPSAASRELANRLERTILEYRAEHPKTSNADVSFALQTTLSKIGPGRRLSRVQALAVGFGLSLLFGATALTARMLGGNDGDLLVFGAATFVVVSLAVVFVAARRNG